MQAANGSSADLASPPPLLSPIKDSKPISSPAGKSLPKLQRIDQLDNGRNGLGEQAEMEMPHNLQQSQDAPECQSLVGAVTSWLPHNVKIVDNPETTEAPRPQYVEYLAGRKFLVIPKHNFMSVSGSSISRAQDAVQPTEVPVSSGNMSSERVLPESKDSATGVNEGLCEVKDEPLSPLKLPEEEVIDNTPAECNGEENITQEMANVENDE